MKANQKAANFLSPLFWMRDGESIMFYVQTVSPLHLFSCTKKEMRNVTAVLRKAPGALGCRYVFGQKRQATQLWAALAKL